ncbi:MAG: prephenate dehydrogenase/arogenate dehydrogenase family protein [Chloroflexi bacterium]|nr:prephenate dehydrogenase/arogenate dehydrogenase family protein [Chloroflexota bacterium]
MILPAKISIVGLGLMGGSLALALRLARRVARQSHAPHITIVDTNPQTLQAAEWLADVATADFKAGVAEAELVILATPVRSVLHLLAELGRVRPEGCMALDLGSTKWDICQAMDALPVGFEAMGGHPMCGKETAGLAPPRQICIVIKPLCCATQPAPTERMKSLILDLLRIVGAKPCF